MPLPCAATAASSAAGSTLPCGPGTVTISPPPLKKPAALTSEVRIWARSWQKAAPQDGVIAAIESALAAVPVATQKTLAFASNRSLKRFCSSTDQVSPP